MNVNKLLNDVTLINGETKRMNCPNCGGKNTFTITNNMGSIVWNCYKANCYTKGGTRVHLSSDDIRKSLGKTVSETEEIPAFDKPEFIVRDNKKIQSYCDSWGLDADNLGLLYDVKEHRIVFPIVHNSIMVDATGRTLGKRLPKWKRYGKNNLPYVSGRGSVAVVVEDCVSASVIGSHVFVGVALLGTSLLEAHKKYLAQFSTAIIALDPDASRKALQIRKELRGYVDDVKAITLKDDIKYRNPQDLMKLKQIGEQQWN